MAPTLPYCSDSAPKRARLARLGRTLLLLPLLILAGCIAPVQTPPQAAAPPPVQQPVIPPRDAREDLNRAVDSLAAGLASPAAARGIGRVAVLDPVGPDSELNEFSSYLAGKLIHRLVQGGYFPSVLERRRLQDVLAEQRIELSPQFDPATVAPLGRKLGVQGLVLGRVHLVGGRLVEINLKLIKVETGEVVAAPEASLPGHALYWDMLNRPLLASLRVMVHPVLAEATVTAGEHRRESGPGGALFSRVPQGFVSVAVQAPGHHSAHRTIYLTGDRTLRIDLVRDPAAALVRPPAPAPPRVAASAPAPVYQPPAPVPVAAGPRVRLWAAFQDHAGRVNTLEPGASLYSGQRYLVGLSADTDSYAYLFQLDAGAGLYRLFPRPGGSAFLSAGQRATLPGDGSWLELDGNAGWERLILVISRRPLTELEEPMLAGPGHGPGGGRPLADVVSSRPPARSLPGGVAAADYGGRSFAVGRRIIYTSEADAVYNLEFNHR